MQKNYKLQLFLLVQFFSIVQSLYLKGWATTPCSMFQDSKSNSVQEIVGKKQFYHEMAFPHAAIIKIYTPWCGACSAMEKDFLDVAKKYDSEINFFSINADREENRELCILLGVTAYPTIFVKLTTVHKGLLNKEELTNLVEATLSIKEKNSFVVKEAKKGKKLHKKKIKN